VSYRDIDWSRLQDRYSRWWRGELETPLLYIATCPDPSANVAPRPHDHDAVKKWFMDPEIRMRREHRMATHSWYYADGFPSLTLGRINIMQAAYYGCPTNYAHETIWVDPILRTWDDWEERIRFDAANETWQMTLGQARLALELAGDDCAITIIGGFEGALDNTAAVRGTDRALFDLLEHPDCVRDLERRFLDDFNRHYYGPLLEMLKDNPRGVSLWDMVLMTDGPAHCIQSDFSCMVSPDMFQDLGLWYVQEQARTFPNTVYHLDGANARHHLPALLDIDELDCIQFIYQIPDGWSLLDAAPTVRQILQAGKRAEVFAWKLDDVIPFLQQVPPKGLKLNAWAPNREAARTLCRDICSLGYPA